ncbi:CobW family GTP-binding protein [Amycolatopsis nigrescens]|uniref:CobW family GTP-binding protein n=1 Tax=Amycolatopsis nigrescens TaxID=381445 RepID=UPI000371ABA8|nr:GTP-binding protein [Amycolatopsis nigrescens]
MARNRNPIPVIIVAGFLGSGKTTLLNHLLNTSTGTRIGVVVNDFGSINIDAMTVAGQVDSMISLSNGCLCCAVDATGMDKLLARLAKPRARIDVIVIEASGLAEPRDLIRLVLAGSDPNLVYGGLVEVVDAAEFEHSRARHPELDQHLRFADLVLLNKIDRLDEPARRSLTETVERLAAGTPVLTSTHGRVDPELLFERRETKPATGQLSFDDLRHDHDEHDHCAQQHPDHLHSAYQSVEFSTDHPLDPRRFMAFLDDRPAGLYRIKGFVYFGVTGHQQRFGMQTVGAHLRFTRSNWASGEKRGTRLVLIGAGIDAGALRERLAGCVADDPQQADEQSMLRVLRFADD